MKQVKKLRNHLSFVRSNPRSGSLTTKIILPQRKRSARPGEITKSNPREPPSPTCPKTNPPIEHQKPSCEIIYQMLKFELATSGDDNCPAAHCLDSHPAMRERDPSENVSLLCVWKSNIPRDRSQKITMKLVDVTCVDGMSCFIDLVNEPSPLLYTISHIIYIYMWRCFEPFPWFTYENCNK